MFGFRIGESGQSGDFYKGTYLQALKNAPTGLKIYVRTWIANPLKVREIGAIAKQHLYIEPKYNGEHLGLPYQAVQGGRQYPPSGSYENYSDYPRELFNSLADSRSWDDAGFLLDVSELRPPDSSQLQVRRWCRVFDGTDERLLPRF